MDYHELMSGPHAHGHTVCLKKLRPVLQFKLMPKLMQAMNINCIPILLQISVKFLPQQLMNEDTITIAQLQLILF